MEQGPYYSVDVGFMEGMHDQQIEVKVDVLLGTAGNCLVLLDNAIISGNHMLLSAIREY